MESASVSVMQDPITTTSSLSPENSVTHTTTCSEVAQDVVSVQSTNCFTVSRFIFSCLLKGQANGVSGMADLGRTKIDLPSSLASTENSLSALLLLPKVLPFLGDCPYVFLPNVDASQLLTYTPLTLIPVSAHKATCVHATSSFSNRS